MSSPLNLLPLYRSLDHFRAAPITAIEDLKNNRFILTLDQNQKVEMENWWIQKFKPVVGGYFVVDKDSYRSYISQEVFEKSFALIG